MSHPIQALRRESIPEDLPQRNAADPYRGIEAADRYIRPRAFGVYPGGPWAGRLNDQNRWGQAGDDGERLDDR
jgi:hypothetical protein